ncbi:MAG: hypothetical protein Kow0037_11220 [Calditrichia bacterium]
MSPFIYETNNQSEVHAARQASVLWQNSADLGAPSLTPSEFDSCRNFKVLCPENVDETASGEDIILYPANSTEQDVQNQQYVDSLVYIITSRYSLAISR